MNEICPKTVDMSIPNKRKRKEIEGVRKTEKEGGPEFAF